MPKPKNVMWITVKDYDALPVNQRALVWASSLVGEKEQGHNAGPFVTKLLGDIGLGPGFPWCAAFVSYALRKAGSKAGPKFGRGAVRNWAKWALNNGMLVAEPKRGDLFFWLNPNKTGHIGFITSVSNSFIDTIEGNTNDAGSREGDGTYRRRRELTKGMRFIRIRE